MYMYIWRRGNVDLLVCETHAVHVRCIWQGPARYTLCTSNESYREGAYIIMYTLCVHVYGVSHAEGACAAELVHGGKWDGMVPKILPLSDVWKETPDSKCLCALLLYEKLLAQGSLPDFGGAGAFPVRYARCLFGVPYIEGGWLYPPLPVRCRVCTFVPNAVRMDNRMRCVSR